MKSRQKGEYYLRFISVLCCYMLVAAVFSWSSSFVVAEGEDEESIIIDAKGDIGAIDQSFMLLII
jgi:hypothetical protein